MLGGSEVKVSASNAGNLGSIPGLVRSPGEGNGNPLQYSCLENPMDGNKRHECKLEILCDRARNMAPLIYLGKKALCEKGRTQPLRVINESALKKACSLP